MQGRESEQKALFGTTPIDELLPPDHPLRKIRSDFDSAYSRVAPLFEGSYGSVGNVSIPPAVLLRAWLLKALYSLRSERALCEQIAFNAMFRWFVGLDWDSKVFDHSTLSRNRDRLFGSGAAEALLGEVVRLAQSRRLLQSDRLVVDGTLIKAWASQKSFQPKDGPGDGGNFRGLKRSNATHASTTDADARLIRKGCGQESRMCHLGNILVDTVHGLVKACRVTPACGHSGNAEVLAALDMAKAHMEAGQTLVADRGYDTPLFVRGLHALGIRAHPRGKRTCTQVDSKLRSSEDYQSSMKQRYRPEPVFGWLKSPGRMGQTKLRGTAKVNGEMNFYCLAFNLVRMANLT